MAYDIPQELKYKEIFAYGMTIRQFVYVAVFGVAAVVIFSQSGLPKEIGALIGLTLIGIAVLLGFFEFDKRIIEFIAFMRTPKNVTFLSKDAAKFLGIKYIRDSAIVLSDKTFVGVIRVEAINFSILSKEQKNAIIYNFMNFLNSLDFRIQVIMRTVTLDMHDYLSNLEKKVSDNPDGSIAEYYSFKDFLETYVEENKVTDRVFYIVVPLRDEHPVGFKDIFKPGLLKKSTLAFRELDERMVVVQEWIAKSLLESRRLDSWGIFTFLASFFDSSVNLDPESTSLFTTHDNGGENVLEKEA